MIEHRIEKATGDVTNAAILRGWKMVDVLAACGDAIVTRSAVIHDAGMIKHRGREGCGAMAS